MRIQLNTSDTQVVLRDPLHFGTEAFGATPDWPASMTSFMHQNKIVLIIVWCEMQVLLLGLSYLSYLSYWYFWCRPYAVATIENVMEQHYDPGTNASSTETNDKWTSDRCERWACRWQLQISEFSESLLRFPFYTKYRHKCGQACGE